MLINRLWSKDTVLPILEILLFILFGDFFSFSSYILYQHEFIRLVLLKSEINPENMKNIVANPKDWIYKKLLGTSFHSWFYN